MLAFSWLSVISLAFIRPIVNSLQSASNNMAIPSGKATSRGGKKAKIMLKLVTMTARHQNKTTANRYCMLLTHREGARNSVGIVVANTPAKSDSDTREADVENPDKVAGGVTPPRELQGSNPDTPTKVQ